MYEPLRTLLLLLICFSLNISRIKSAKYYANWDSLDTRPLPTWFDDVKIGIFLHWGVYSVPSFGGEWFWAYWKGNSSTYVDFMKKNYPPNFTYQDFAPQFTAQFYKPDQWADLFYKAGAKYVVLTSKHHEGFTLFPSKYSFSWNAMDVGPKRDLLGDLAKAVRAKNMTFGTYYSLYEWYNPIYRNDKANNWTTSNFVDNKMLPEMKQLINDYLPEILWVDGDWEAYDTYFKSTKFLAWLYNDSPVKNTVVVNDRWGIGIPCKHGDFWTCADRFNPGHLMPKKWENAMTVDRSTWGYRRNIVLDDILSTEELITTLVVSVSCGGNVLINVGPTKEGTIIPIFQERLLQLGNWLQINGEAIYGTSPWLAQNDTLSSDVWYTLKNNSIYAISLSWPDNNVLSLESIAPLFQYDRPLAVLLGNENLELVVNANETQVDIILPDKAEVRSQWAWTVKFIYNNIQAILI